MILIVFSLLLLLRSSSSGSPDNRRRLLRFSTPLSSPLREEAGVYYSATITKIKFGIWMQVPEKDKTDTRDG